MMRIIFMVLLAVAASLARADTASPQALMEYVDDYAHTRGISESTTDVINHEIGLGAMQKVRGEWRFKYSERLSGTLISQTWQVVDGFSASEVLDELLVKLESYESATLMFACDGRACGQSAQWANRVFNERLLYGREDLQRYRVFDIDGERAARLIIYSAERTMDMQYLRINLLLIDD